MSEEIKKEQYVEVDKNLMIETSFPETDVRFHSVREEPFDLYNFYDPKNQPIFRRLPDIYKQLNELQKQVEELKKK